MQLIVGTVFLLAGQGASSISDKRLFSGAGVRDMRHFFSVAEALRAIGEEKPALLIVHEYLNDMTVTAAVRYLRMHPASAALPIVALAGSERVARMLEKQGGCAHLPRPFTDEDAVAAIARAKQPSCLHLSPEAVEKARQRAEREEKARERAELFRQGDRQSERPPVAERKKQPRGNVSSSLYEGGLEALRRGELEKAARAFERAFEQNPLHASACLGRSRVSVMEGDALESARWQCLAGICCLRAGNAVAAQNIFLALPRNLPEGNVLLPHALNLLAEGEEKLAAMVLLEAHSLERDTPLHQMVGRAMLFTPNPEEGMRGVCRGFDRAGYNSTARLLHSRLFAEMPEPQEADETGFLDAFPWLRDALHVAGHTFSLWRAA